MPAVRIVLLNLAAAGAHGALVEVGLALNAHGAVASPFWPASGLALALCFRLGARVLPGIFCSSLRGGGRFAGESRP